MSREHILGIDIDSVTMAEALECAEQWLDGDTPRMIVTPNPEILLAARGDKNYTAILNSADLSLPDGRGLQFFGDFAERITGVDFSTELLRVATEKGKRVLCVVREDGRSTAAEVQSAIADRFEGLAVTAIPVRLDNWDTDVIVDQVLAAQPALILVGLGFPHQEKWLAHHLDHIPSARIGIGVGGTFDFWTGKASRAPRLFRALGLEWLYRLAREPRRFGRIWRAVVIFPLVAFFKK